MSVEQKTVNGKTLAQGRRAEPHIREWARTKLAYDDAVNRVFIPVGGLKLTLDGETRIEPPEGYRIEHVGVSGALTHVWFEQEDDR